MLADSDGRLQRHPRAVLVAFGAAGGVLAGLFGIGGGAILVIGLVLLGFSQHRAHATSLAAILVIAPAAALPFALAGDVAVLPAVAIAAGAMGGATLGARAMPHVSPRRLRIGFALLLLALAAQLALAADIESAGVGTSPDAADLALYAVLGVVAGILAGILGVGGGVVMVPGLVLLFGFTQHAAEGTSLLVIVPTALVGAITHTCNGYTDWRAGLTIGLGGLAGGVLGGQLALALPAAWLQRLFAVLLVVIAVQLLRTRRSPDPDPGPDPA